MCVAERRGSRGTAPAGAGRRRGARNAGRGAETPTAAADGDSRCAGRGGPGCTGDDGELRGVPDRDDARLVGDGEEADGGQRVLLVLRFVRR